MANWPTSYDVVLGLVAPATLAGPPTHEQIHEQNAEILAAMQAEFGLSPSGADATVAARLDRLDRSTATVAAAQATSSATYTDLATAGPSVTVATGTLVRVTIMASISTVGGADQGQVALAVSGATTIAAPALNQRLAGLAGAPLAFDLVLPVNAGTNTFTLKYRVEDNDGGGATATFSNRQIIVERLN